MTIRFLIELLWIFAILCFAYLANLPIWESMEGDEG